MPGWLEHLERKLEEHRNSRLKLIITDGVFSMDGDCAKLGEMVGLAEKHDAMVLGVDSPHTPTPKETEHVSGTGGSKSTVETAKRIVSRDYFLRPLFILLSCFLAGAASNLGFVRAVLSGEKKLSLRERVEAMSGLGYGGVSEESRAEKLSGA